MFFLVKQGVKILNPCTNIKILPLFVKRYFSMKTIGKTDLEIWN